MNTILLPSFLSRLWFMPIGIILLLLGQDTFAQSIGVTSFTGITANSVSYQTGAASGTNTINIGGTQWNAAVFITGDVFSLAGRCCNSEGTGNGALGSSDPFIYSQCTTTTTSIDYISIKPNVLTSFKFNSIYVKYNATQPSQTVTVAGYKNNVAISGATATAAITANLAWAQVSAGGNAAFNDVDEIRISVSTNNSGLTASLSFDEIDIAAAIPACSNPVIATQPADATTPSGGIANFSVAATGSSFIYQWQENTGSSWANISDGGVYSGATTATLTITGATAAMAGYQYRCIVSSGACNTTSNGAYLGVGIAAGSVTSSSITADITSQYRASRFTVGCLSLQLSGVRMALGNQGSTGVQQQAYLFADNAGTPGSLLATSNIVAPTTVAPTLGASFYFPAGTVLSANTNYWVAVRSVASTGSYFISTWLNATPAGPYITPLTGVMSSTNATTWNTYPGSQSTYTITYSMQATPLNCSNPTISAGPVAKSVEPGSNASFSVTTSGCVIGYQWQENTGSSWANISDGGVYSGATTATLTITSATAGMNNYQYRAVTSAYTCSTTSSAAALTVSNNSTTWDGTTWSNGAPTATIDATLASSVSPGSFTCKNLTINSGIAITISSGSSVTVNGNIINNGDGYTGSGNLNINAACSIQGNNQFYFLGNLFVNSGATLTTNGNLRVGSNVTRTGRIGTSAGTISGNVTVERYIPGGRRAFRFLSHPFSTSIALSQYTDDIDITGSGGAANGFAASNTNNPSAFWFNPVTGDNTTTGVNPGWTAFTNTNGAGANALPRYGAVRILVRGVPGEGLNSTNYTPSATTIDVTGVINQGTQTVTLTKGSGSDFVFVGNPYVNQVNMLNLTRTNIGSAYYVWNANMGTKGAYETKSFTSPPFFYLPSCTAFITTLTAANGTIEFEEADKANNTPGNIVKVGGFRPVGLDLIIEDSTLAWDRITLNFDNNSESGKDYFDALKLENPEVNFYCMSSNGKCLSIDSRPFVDAEVMKLGFVSPVKQDFKIKAENFNLPTGIQLFLNDKYLNKKVEIIGNEFEYWFNVNEDAGSSGNERFELITEGQLLPSASSLATTSYFNKNNSKVINHSGIHSIKN